MSKIVYSRQLQAALDVSRQLAGSGNPAVDHITSARELLNKLVVLAETPQRVFSIVDTAIDAPAGTNDAAGADAPSGKIPIRVYKPSAQDDQPAILYFHGGWFFAGGLDTHDRLLRALANAAHATIVAVDYRLAPEHPFPAAVNDAFNALRWLVSNGQSIGVDPSRIAIAGDSAGGALAAVTAHKAIESSIPIQFQALIYPVTDSSLSTDSWREFADGPVITLDIAKEAWNMYTPDSAQRKDPDAAPLHAEHLEGLPPTLVVLGEYDPLRDEGRAYAAKLRNAGVQVTERLYPGMPHGFFQMGAYLAAGRQAMAEVAMALATALHKTHHPKTK